MRARKAARPATARAVNGPRFSERSGRQLTSHATSSQRTHQAVYDGRHHVGFIALRHEAGVEAFDVAKRSLVTDMKVAIAAIPGRLE